jgi:hypothetical protein
MGNSNNSNNNVKVVIINGSAAIILFGLYIFRYDILKLINKNQSEPPATRSTSVLHQSNTKNMG